MLALVGYTNAGKSTLFNRLTGAKVEARDMLFATLDPTLREVKLPGGRPAILSDTVGFISDLPHELVEAFRATLDEVRQADIILHVRDIAGEQSEAEAADVKAVLAEIGVKPDGGPVEPAEEGAEPAPARTLIDQLGQQGQQGVDALPGLGRNGHGGRGG